MLNKKTVLFVTKERDKALALSVKKNLCAGDIFAGVLLGENQLKKWWAPLAEKLLPEGSFFYQKYKKAKRKFLYKKTKTFNYGEWIGLSEKKLLNVINRFTPNIIVVSSPEGLCACASVLSKVAVPSKLCVICDDSFVAEDFYSERIDCIFVSNMGRRDELLKMGIPVEKIEIGLVNTFDAYCDVEQKTRVREELGLNPSDKVVLLNVEEGGAKFRKAIGMYLEQDQREVRYLFYCGKDKQMEDFINDKMLPVCTEEQKTKVLLACDLVVSVPDNAFISEVQSYYKKVIVFNTENVDSFTYKNLISGTGIHGADDTQGLLDEIKRSLPSNCAEGESEYALFHLVSAHLKETLLAQNITQLDEPTLQEKETSL